MAEPTSQDLFKAGYNGGGLPDPTSVKQQHDYAAGQEQKRIDDLIKSDNSGSSSGSGQS